VRHIKNTNIDYDDYDYNKDEEEDPFTLDERYYDDQYICPECGARKMKYYESFECRGHNFRQEIWECPNNC
jgi:rubredoxin